jgi:outer membrane biosynthesis protein TonB
MFAIDQKVTHIELRDKNIFKVFLSMNNHLVATPDTSLEEARSYVFFFREGKKKYSAYIGLHLLITDRKLFYAHSANPFLEDDLQNVEDEARNFAEDLGAMLDEVDFASMSDLEQEHWAEEQSIFTEKKQPEAEPEEQTPRAPVAAAAPAEKSPEAPEKPAPAAESVSAPQAPETPVKPVLQPSYAEVPEEQPLEAAAPEPVQKSDETKSAQLAAAKRRQEITRRTAAVDTTKAQKQTAGKGPPSATGVVSRDREALARLLTSF